MTRSFWLSTVCLGCRTACLALVPCLLALLLLSPASAQHLLAEFKYIHPTDLSNYIGPPDSLEFYFSLYGGGDQPVTIFGDYGSADVGRVIVASPSDLAAFASMLQYPEIWTSSSAKLSCPSGGCGAGYDGQRGTYPFADYGPVNYNFGGTSEMTHFVPDHTTWTLTSVEQTIDAASATLRPDLDLEVIHATGFGAFTMRFYGTAPGIVPEPASWIMLLLVGLHLAMGCRNTAHR